MHNNAVRGVQSHIHGHCQENTSGQTKNKSNFVEMKDTPKEEKSNRKNHTVCLLNSKIPEVFEIKEEENMNSIQNEDNFNNKNNDNTIENTIYYNTEPQFGNISNVFSANKTGFKEKSGINISPINFSNKNIENLKTFKHSSSLHTGKNDFSQPNQRRKSDKSSKLSSRPSQICNL